MKFANRALARHRRCLIAVSFFATLVLWVAFPVPADAAHCGGSGERACCLVPPDHFLGIGGLAAGCEGSLVEGPPDPSGCSFGTCQAADGAGFPVGCGGTPSNVRRISVLSPGREENSIDSRVDAAHTGATSSITKRPATPFTQRLMLRIFINLIIVFILCLHPEQRCGHVVPNHRCRPGLFR